MSQGMNRTVKYEIMNIRKHFKFKILYISKCRALIAMHCEFNKHYLNKLTRKY